MKKRMLAFCIATALQPAVAQQQAVLTETIQSVKTYPFSDPDPVAACPPCPIAIPVSMASVLKG